jgi:hypothetical protein
MVRSQWTSNIHTSVKTTKNTPIGAFVTCRVQIPLADSGGLSSDFQTRGKLLRARKQILGSHMVDMFQNISQKLPDIRMVDDKRFDRGFSQVVRHVQVWIIQICEHLVPNVSGISERVFESSSGYGVIGRKRPFCMKKGLILIVSNPFWSDV